MNKWAEIFFGLILLVGSICLAFISQSWGQAAVELLKGAIIWILILLGILLVILGINDLKD